MNRFVFAALFVLAAYLTPSAQAQIIFARPARPSGDPRFGAAFGQPRVGTGFLFQQGPLTVQPQATVTPGLQTGSTSTAVDVGTPAITGHPTRFAAYSGYFSNQGGGSGIGSSVTPPSRTPPARAVLGGPATQPSSTPPARSKSGASGVIRQPRR
jgi:hypothetical protein